LGQAGSCPGAYEKIKITPEIAVKPANISKSNDPY
jgi:hypothetical protein